MTNLGNLGGTGFNIAVDINNQGQVVGVSSLRDDATIHVFLWQDGVMADLGTLPGDVVSSTSGINSKGQVVGASFDTNGNPRTFLWQNGVMTNLNTLIPADSPLFLLAAKGTINSRGQIAGFGLEKSTGEVHAFLLTPSNNGFASESATLTDEVRPAEARSSFSQRMFARCCGRVWLSRIRGAALRVGA